MGEPKPDPSNLMDKTDKLERLFPSERATSVRAKLLKRRNVNGLKTKASSVCEDNIETVDCIDSVLPRDEVSLLQSSSACETTPSEWKKRKTANDDKGFESALQEVADAVRQSNEAIKESILMMGKYRTRVYSGEEVTALLVELGVVDSQSFDDAYLFLTDNPDQARKVFGYPAARGRLNFLKKLMHPTRDC